MLTVREALRARLLANASFVTALGGEHVYQEDQDLNVQALISGGAKAIVTFGCISDSPDDEVPYLDQGYQFDVWSETPNIGDQVVELLTSALAWRQGVAGTGILPGLVGRRLAAPVTSLVVPRDMPRDSGPSALFHRLCSFRVATYAN